MDSCTSKKEVLPQSSIDVVEISNIASELGVDPERLKQVAPYFDQNQDQVLQQSELQQAAMSIANQPNTLIHNRLTNNNLHLQHQWQVFLWLE